MCTARCAREFTRTVNDICAPSVPANLTSRNQFLQNRLQLQSQFGIVAAVMQLININEIGLQTTQAVFHVSSHILDNLTRVTVYRFLFFVDDVPKFGGN